MLVSMEECYRVYRRIWKVIIVYGSVEEYGRLLRTVWKDIIECMEVLKTMES